MRDFDNRIKKMREILKSMSFFTLHYKNGAVRTAKPIDAVREVLHGNKSGVVKISGSEGASGRFVEILQAIVDLDKEE